MIWLNFSSRSVSSTALLLNEMVLSPFFQSARTDPFRRSASQYRASNSGDLVVFPAAAVTALLLMNLPHAYRCITEMHGWRS